MKIKLKDFQANTSHVFIYPNETYFFHPKPVFKKVCTWNLLSKLLTIYTYKYRPSLLIQLKLQADSMTFLIPSNK